MTLADKIAVMNQGNLLQFDEPHIIYDQPKNSFVAGFIGNPAMNLIDGTIESNEFMTDFLKFKFKTENRDEVAIGVRPQNIKICSTADSFGSGRIF